MEIELNTSELKEKAKTLRAGDKVLLTGTVYTSRDAAHKRIKACIDKGEPLPYDLDGAAIYYAGPTQAKEGMAIGSCGPTTSSRMDVYSPLLLDMGLSAIGGAGALACKCITECEVIAFEDLGCESVKRLHFEKFPLIVTIDCVGGNLFRTGRAEYSREA